MYVDYGVIKGTVTPVRVWQKVARLERKKIGKELLMVLICSVGSSINYNIM